MSLPEDSSNENLLRKAQELLRFIDNPSAHSWNDRDRAAKLLVALASSHEAIFQAVREAADEYVRYQSIDDTFPWTPNAEEMLARAKGSPRSGTNP